MIGNTGALCSILAILIAFIKSMSISLLRANEDKKVATLKEDDRL
jgi:hypothetical protein